jgi:hypothetical protein
VFEIAPHRLFLQGCSSGRVHLLEQRRYEPRVQLSLVFVVCAEGGFKES